MRIAVTNKVYTEEEYIQFEWTADRRHELINGQLFEMPGESDINNKIGLCVAYFFMQRLSNHYDVFAHDVKVAIPNTNNYYYPDVFVTKEPKTDKNKYIKYSPEIVVEVVSPSSHTNDYVDKYLDYIKIPTLKYYLIIEPSVTLITLYAKSENGWEAQKFSSLSEELVLKEFDIKMKLTDIYK